MTNQQIAEAIAQQLNSQALAWEECNGCLDVQLADGSWVTTEL